MNAPAASAPRGRVALVLGETMDGSTLQVLGDACTRVNARLWVWGTDEEQGSWPSVVVAALSAGTRHIPAPIIELADRRYPGTQLLLLCDEPLIRPSLSLQHGRITLVEPPATVERMTSRLRLLLARDPRELAEGTTSHVMATPGLVRCQEYRRPSWWAGELSCNSPSGETAVRPWLRFDQGLTAILAPRDGSVGEDQVERAVELVRQDGESSDIEDGLTRVLGPSSGLVHLAQSAQNWLIFWPCHHRPLWLFSPLRLPRWSDLSNASGASLWHLPAVAGDVIAALSSRSYFGSTGSLRSFLPPTEVSSAMLDGGPALLELFESQLGAAPKPFSCLLAEVR
jgi:hypothetical protein